MESVEERACFGGLQHVLRHPSTVLGCEMRVGVFVPPQGPDRPVLLFLSGLTCTEQNVITKAGAQRYCAEHGLVLVTPDTSPRGEAVPDHADYDLGQGAGFYLTATQEPWATHYHMDRYICEELRQVLRPMLSNERWGITGHSMGGHGALVLALRNPGLFASVSAFSPILQPLDVPWGHKAFEAYLGPDRAAWAAYDAASLVASAPERLPMLIDQGGADNFLPTQLHADRFLAACQEAGHTVNYRLQPGYDHSYYFIASFMGEHVAHHAAALLS
ncbi:MAG: S-formylglutathione hydrolase [Myxococcota bacterium]